MKMVIGLDVHSKQTTYVAQQADGTMVAEGQVATSEAGLAEMLGRVGAPVETRIGLESGTSAFVVCRWLLQAGMRPVVIDAAEVRAKARRLGQKSDRRDAFEICDGLRRDQYVSRVYVPDLAVQRLRMLLSRRRHFVRLSTSQINAAKFLLRVEARPWPKKTLTTDRAWRELLNTPGLADLRPCLELHYAAWCLARQHITYLETELEEALEPFRAEVNLLTTVPGVGQLVAASFIAAVGDPQRFPDSGHLASYLGLTPSTYDSGETEHHGSITGRGPTLVRAMLCEAAQHARRPSHPLQPYWRLLASRGGYRKAIVAVAHRLARILFQMWRHHEPFQVERLRVVYEPRTEHRTHYYRLPDARHA